MNAEEPFAQGDVPSYNAAKGIFDPVAGAVTGITVEDGSTTVTPATTIDFTAGATVTDLGGGVAGVAISGGGSAGVVAHGPFTIAHNTAGLAAGIPTFTPAAGDLLLDAFFVIDTAFDGTTPSADFGANASGGIFNNFATTVLLDDTADAPFAGLIYTTSPKHSLRDTVIDNAAAGGTDMAYRATWLFETAAPLLVWASQNGTQGGTAINSTVGSARLYIITATPV